MHARTLTRTHEHTPARMYVAVASQPFFLISSTWFSFFCFPAMQPAKKQRVDAPAEQDQGSKPVSALGSADPLMGPLWKMWLDHVLEVGPTWLYVVLMLTHVSSAIRTMHALIFIICH